MSAPLATLRPAQVAMARATLTEVIEDGAAADRALARQIRGQRKMGARDRRWLSALVFGVLRRSCALRERAGDDVDAWLAAELADRHGAGDGDLDRLGLPGAPAVRALSAGARRNWPAWLNDAAEARFDDARCDALAATLAMQADVDLRVNRLRADRDSARRALAADGIEAEPIAWCDDALRLHARRPLQHTRAWRDGLIEPQDAGSQLVCELLAPVAGERIADWCAGAGGKALAMAGRQGDRGEIVALDVDGRRLSRIAPRAQRLGVTSIRALLLGDHDSEAHFDGVLVDAPCSGSGTWRRHPDQALRSVDLRATAATQLAILRAAAGAVRPGGRLVYATCSFLPQENDDVVSAFLRDAPDFTIVPARSVVGDIADDADDPWLRLTPDRHGCDAFCAVRLQRTATAPAG
ncbi:RsmB/NOP family class I SAM-dependent RNA methyltransferase [Algiphilus sp.]|uniref:RsmB/NOP family class I SAM-dependent RNA methyltransferase n=1 Tax=Algiphilus sp. TaxID=1872431 RepID=UPI0025BB4DF7|nr:RsmB/NOP family class I SAM-dependent RNA methyltransferase [Algiphilus sp.]MCK5770439.1 RsmB/NOP family class I SAM-dependent RNA methyltransferase [Algiphilus sp.]